MSNQMHDILIASHLIKDNIRFEKFLLDVEHDLEMTSTTLNATLVESGTLKNARDFQTVTFTLINISCVIRPSYFESYDVVVETIYAVLQ